MLGALRRAGNWARLDSCNPCTRRQPATRRVAQTAPCRRVNPLRYQAVMSRARLHKTIRGPRCSVPGMAKPCSWSTAPSLHLTTPIPWQNHGAGGQGSGIGACRPRQGFIPDCRPSSSALARPWFPDAVLGVGRPTFVTASCKKSCALTVYYWGSTYRYPVRRMTIRYEKIHQSVQ